MTEQLNRRAEDEHMEVLATKIEGLAQDMNEMKHGIAKMANALTKLAIVEERQRLHELVCNDQDKEVRQLIADSNERLSTRVAELEKAEPMQEQTGKWVMAAVWGAAGLLALFVAKQLGLV